MQKIHPKAQVANAERHANRILRQLNGRPATEVLATVAAVALFVTNDPTAPAKPAVIEDFGAACQRFMAEFVAWSESSRGNFAESFRELGEPIEPRPS